MMSAGAESGVLVTAYVVRLKYGAGKGNENKFTSSSIYNLHRITKQMNMDSAGNVKASELIDSVAELVVSQKMPGFSDGDFMEDELRANASGLPKKEYPRWLAPRLAQGLNRWVGDTNGSNNKGLRTQNFVPILADGFSEHIDDPIIPVHRKTAKDTNLPDCAEFYIILAVSPHPEQPLE
jgi:hypothetical protein